MSAFALRVAVIVASDGSTLRVPIARSIDIDLMLGEESKPDSDFETFIDGAD